PSPQPTTGSWARDSAGWRYVLSDGTAVAHQVKEIGGVVYAFDATGHIARGWYRGPQGRWYLSSDHGVRTGWQRDGATWYYLGSSGAMATKWLLDGGTWYFMRDSGAMATGWVRDGSHWYHLSSSGAMTTGWLHSGDWYYLDPSSGGAMATGWRSIGGRWSYFDAWDGFWVTNRAGFDADWAYARTLYSPTNYLIVVDTSAPHCMSFYWRDGAWQPHHDWPCSVGAGSTPTVRGTFSIGSRGRSFGSGYTAYWWTQFHHDYLFHSILYHQGTYTVQDGTLGGHVSHGCVRMRFQDAKWIHDNVPSGTRVVIY
ncbi:MULTISPECIES: L,D-transpeptidase, partial [unclassified Actinomyces]